MEDFRDIELQKNIQNLKEENEGNLFLVASWQVMFLTLSKSIIFDTDSQYYNVEASLPISIETGEIKKLFLHSVVLMFDPARVIDTNANIDLAYKILFSRDGLLNYQSTCGGGKREE